MGIYKDIYQVFFKEAKKNLEIGLKKNWARMFSRNFNWGYKRGKRGSY